MRKHHFLPAFLLAVGLIMNACDKSDSGDEFPPEACFSYELEMQSGVPYSFDSSCSMDAVSYLWDFGDGTTSEEAHPTHTFSSDGRFVVSLTASNDLGSDTFSREVTVSAQ